ncbi:T9SS type A sorting domain-containing protein [Aquimarina sp. ERC-38]|uniref:T9SS type A sorting domain-containing protein n=1 Tax=Aquimarina sp. ERC-38 TaxID=2949996 RepID=UPI0022456B82|nr:T9SS type A sorting domain-containing protein [Aquimarina sp. ERC-38]UZO81159.1 T9SS type A sorting domain-containing protein [Aquimarina sp. ERC-38]
MKKLLFPFLCFFLVNAWSQQYQDMIESGDYTLSQIQKEAENYFKTHDTGKGSGYKQYKRWEYNATLSVDENGYLRPDSYYFDELKKYNSYRNKRKKAATNDNWVEMGPTYYRQTSGWNPGIGRVQSLAVDTNNPEHIIIGSGTGGIWQTFNEGKDWVSLTDNFNNLRAYSLAMDQKNPETYYWGSSNGRIYKSTDAGSTWFVVGNTHDNAFINQIKIHPKNSNIIFVSAAGRNREGLSRFGIYKSIDAGKTWKQVIKASSTYDIEFKPGNPKVVYASGNNVFRSTNGGESFKMIGEETFTTWTKMLAVTPANPDKIYVVERENSAFGAFYVSEDSGNSFTLKEEHKDKNYFNYSSQAEKNDTGQAPRDMDIAASPTDENEVHIAGILSWMSTDGGTSFKITSQWQPGSAKRQNIGYCHADIDIMEYIGNKLYVGTDGGIAIADDPQTINAEYYREIGEGIGIRDFYRLGVSQTKNVVITAGSQDNGTSAFTKNKGWTDWLGADGMESFVDKNDPNILYGTSQFGSLYKSLNQGRRLTGIKTPDDKKGEWITPFEQDPIEPNTIYTGYDQVYKSIDGGATWTAISQVLLERGLNHLKIAPSDNSVMYTAFGKNLYVETNGDKIWELANSFSSNINAIAIHPKNPNKIAVATSNGEKIYISEDTGDTWKSLKKNLPNFTPYSLIWQDNSEDGLYVGMSYGIYYTDNTLDEWESFGNKLPNVQISEMEINYKDNRIYAATYGRGMWSSPIYSNKNVLSIEESFKKSGISIYPNPSSNVINVSAELKGDSEVRLFNNQGQIVYFNKKISLSSPLQINTSQLATGIYYLRINSELGEFTEKVLLQ